MVNVMFEDDKTFLSCPTHHRQSGQNITAEGITVVDLKTEETKPDKSLEVNKNKKQVKNEAGSDQFKNLSKTSAKSSYPEVVTESSHQVNCFS